MKKSLPFALAAFALATTANAQVSAALDDLVLGFRATGGQGQNTNLEVDLGSVSQFQNLAAGTTLSVARLSASDLTSIYGSGWATRTDLYWGVVGTAGRTAAGPNGSPIGTVWATRAQDTIGTQSIAWAPGSRGAMATPASLVEAMLTGGTGSLNGARVTSNSSSSSAINATLAGSWTAQNGFVTGTSFGFFNPTVEAVAKPSSGSYSAADLYEVQPGASASTYLGTFALNSNGTLTFTASASGPSGSTPVITVNPTAQAVAINGNATFSVTATGSNLTYQWYKDGTAISGATSSSYAITGATSAQAGNYTVKVSSGSNSVTSTAVALIVGAVPDQGRIINLSLLTNVASGETVTFGFFTGGAGTSGAKPVLMRAMGPSLAAFSISDFLPDPYLEFYNDTTKATQNDDWSGDPSIASTVTAVSAFPYASVTSKDAGIYVSNVANGGHSLKISGNASGTGQVIAELYDATPSSGFTSTTPRLINVSVLKNVGNLVTVGFNIAGSTKVKVLIRAVGPSLSAFNISGAMADPQLTVYPFGAGKAAIASNDNWGSDATQQAAIQAAMTAVNAFGIPASSKDAAVLLQLDPGAYTVQVTPVSGTTSGTGIVELYEIP